MPFDESFYPECPLSPVSAHIFSMGGHDGKQATESDSVGECWSMLTFGEYTNLQAREEHRNTGGNQNTGNTGEQEIEGNNTREDVSTE